uniref:EF-hand domain-containing protein n=1 Tax=Phytophthora ramorum TaxID=164328 RepID=H3GR53_PHYRM
MAASLAVPDFVESMGDPYYPSFDELDQDRDGVVGYQEYMRDLNKVWTKDEEDIANSDLPEIVENDLYDQLNDTITSDTACVKKAMTKKRALTFDRKAIDSLLKCTASTPPSKYPRSQKYMETFPDNQAPGAATPRLSLTAVSAPPAVTERVTVDTDGPVDDDKQVVTTTTADGSKSTTTVDVTKTSDGNNELEIPTGPEGTTTTVTVPSSSSGGETTTDILNQLGVNDIDKDIMTKDEF